MEHRRNLERLRGLMRRMGRAGEREGATGCERVVRWAGAAVRKREAELCRLGFGIIKQRFHTAALDGGQLSCSRTGTFKAQLDRKSIWSSRQEQEKEILRGSKTFQIDDELLPLVDADPRARKERPASLAPFDPHLTPKKPKEGWLSSNK